MKRRKKDRQTKGKQSAAKRKVSKARVAALFALGNAEVPHPGKFTDAIAVYEVVTETGRILDRFLIQHVALAYSKAHNSLDFHDEPEQRSTVRVRMGSLQPLRLEEGAA
ncbi:hypothetical protein [Anatilimnocola floriformis]|uniref:hypothetical protein n=1 Tax=Anatilimnocola floriformis TaxID=2948575 RepID=UPI0020C4B23E|nr:hypothetical protein [Anatilimnocola floriformis]